MDISHCQLRPLAEAQEAGDPEALGWQKYCPNARLLAELASTGQTVSHDMPTNSHPPTRTLRPQHRSTPVSCSKRHEDPDWIPLAQQLF
jgi:hypothetical protein